jgi:3',5'-cyclic AMP phosphodiesterase CpdA
VLIAQISDLHITDRVGLTSSLVDANANLERAIEFLNRLRPRPDVAVASGDLTDNGLPTQYQALVALLGRLELPCFVIPGNHDDRSALLGAFADHTYLRRDGGPLHFAIDDYPVRLVGIDTTRPGRHDGRFAETDRSWLDDTLLGRPDTPTLVFMHHPPFDTGIWWMDCVGLPAEDRIGFEAVIRRHPQVRRVVCGHVHRAVQLAWSSTVVSVAPSTAHQVGLDLEPGAAMSLTDEPPMITLLDWTDERILTHTCAFLPARSVDLGAAMSPGAKEKLMTRPPAPKGGGFT